MASFAQWVSNIGIFNGIPNDRIGAVGQAVDDCVVFAVNDCNSGRNMMRSSIRFDNYAGSDFGRVNAIRYGDCSFHICVEAADVYRLAAMCSGDGIIHCRNHDRKAIGLRGTFNYLCHRSRQLGYADGYLDI